MTGLESTLRRIKENISVNPEKPHYECPECRDTGFIQFTTDEGRISVRECSCQAVKQSKQLMEQSGISREFNSKGFKNFDTKNIPQLIIAKRKAINYFKEFKDVEQTRNNSIMFCGQVGSGKTHLGVAISRSLMSKNIAVIYMAYRNAITKIKQVLIDSTDYYHEISRYSQARVLYIDDFLKGKVTEADVNIVYEIVNYRYMNNLPLIISTEKSLDEIITFDEAIGSRIIEMCRGNIVHLQGKELNHRLYS
ncbi:MAG: ATP-binding protein [Clostridia bacterium]|nr:ATP-binding protein [Clostridia bacterium]